MRAVFDPFGPPTPESLISILRDADSHGGKRMLALPKRASESLWTPQAGIRVCGNDIQLRMYSRPTDPPACNIEEGRESSPISRDYLRLLKPQVKELSPWSSTMAACTK